MSKPTFVLCLLFCIVFGLSAQNSYNQWFENAACRIDFYLTGSNTTTEASLYRIHKEPVWGGRKSQLSTDVNLGQYRFRLIDSISNQLIYTDGFSTLFTEWQSTPEAQHTSKGFEQSIQFPYPLKTATVIIEKRLDFSHWNTLLIFSFRPDDKHIDKTRIKDTEVKVIAKTADTDKALDIAVIAEGYSARQRNKFYKDAARLAESICKHAPFSAWKNHINIYAVATISADSGVSAPQKEDWRSTALGAHYYTFYSDRYLTTPNVFKLHDYASVVPYDAIYILANTKTYGGGGIYNFYAMASADSKRAQSEVVVHEFGHSFAGLADEYFYDNDALNDMYDLKDEPWEPNISSLVHFDKKWKNELPGSVVIPTPVNDSTKKSIGVFQGGGYMTKGMYRPYFDCRMRTNTAASFCPVCEKAIVNRLRFLTGL